MDMLSLNMSKAGDPNNQHENESAPAKSRLKGALTLIAVAVALVTAFFVGVQVISVLSAILFPPTPPVVANATLISTTNHDYGVDDWVYETEVDACDVAAFYLEMGGVCRFPPATCGEITFEIPQYNQHVARCIGDVEFSIFAMRWRALISTGDRNGSATVFRISREIYWTGAIPPSTADNFFNSD